MYLYTFEGRGSGSMRWRKIGIERESNIRQHQNMGGERVWGSIFLP